jgi:hypothetical protein
VNAVPPVMFAAAGLALAAALFGALLARTFWAGDLRRAYEARQHAEKLRTIWNESETFLKDRIKNQEQIIEIQKNRIENYKRRLEAKP